MSLPICQHAASGCDYPTSECTGMCVGTPHIPAQTEASEATDQPVTRPEDCQTWCIVAILTLGIPLGLTFGLHFLWRAWP